MRISDWSSDVCSSDLAHADKAGMFDEIDTDKDGFMDADEAKAHHEGRCGSDKKADGAKSADKTGMEGKSGEGKCGGMWCRRIATHYARAPAVADGRATEAQNDDSGGLRLRRALRG